MLMECGIHGWHEFYLSVVNGMRKDNCDFYRQLLTHENAAPHQVLIIGDNEHTDIQKSGDMAIYNAHVMRPVELARATPRFEPIIEQAFDPSTQNDLNMQLTIGTIVQANFKPLFYPNFDPADLVPASPWAAGFTIAGPLILSFVQWLAKKAKTDGIERLYFLAREGEILKRVYDLWVSEDEKAVASEYLILSRRAVTVPMIKNLHDIFEIAKTDSVSRPMPDFIFERYGLHLSEAECEELSQLKIWPQKKLITVAEGKIDHLRQLLQALEERILNQAKQEHQALMTYLQNMGLNPDTKAAVVDVGYAATTQDNLNQLLTQQIHGYYLITLDRAEQVASKHQVITQGYYCQHVKTDAIEPVIYRESSTIEKLLSAESAEITRYRMDDNGGIVPEFHIQTHEEKQSAATRAEIQRGIIHFTQQSISIRNNLLNDFEIPQQLAETLFSTFVKNSSSSEQKLLHSLKLGNYCHAQDLAR